MDINEVTYFRSIRYSASGLEDWFIVNASRKGAKVEEKVIVELKSVEKMAPVHKKQLLTYIRLADMRLGLLINFGEELIKYGIKRIVNRLEE